MNEKQINFLMATLDISREEATDIIEKDKIIDEGGNPFPLSKEGEKVAKKMRASTRKVVDPAGKTANRKIKSNPAKAFVIHCIAEGLRKCECATITIDNPERQITLEYNGKKYKIVLSEPRT